MVDGVNPNSTLDRTAGSQSLAAAGQRERSAHKSLVHADLSRYSIAINISPRRMAMARKPGDTNYSPREKQMQAEIQKLKEQLKDQGKKNK